MNAKPIPTETRLLGLTPEQYTHLMERARRDARRLRSEAMHELAHDAAAAVARLGAALQRRVHAALRIGSRHASPAPTTGV
jgi:hypothetical protein